MALERLSEAARRLRHWVDAGKLAEAGYVIVRSWLASRNDRSAAQQRVGSGGGVRVSTLDLANLPRTPQGERGFRAGFL